MLKSFQNLLQKLLHYCYAVHSITKIVLLNNYIISKLLHINHKYYGVSGNTWPRLGGTLGGYTENTRI